jgi:hypothetical protein
MQKVKVFREEGRKLIHEADLNEAGAVMNKHKGPSGEVINIGELIGIGGGK